MVTDQPCVNVMDLKLNVSTEGIATSSSNNKVLSNDPINKSELCALSVILSLSLSLSLSVSHSHASCARQFRSLLAARTMTSM
jgi:hypothetical protein